MALWYMAMSLLMNSLAWHTTTLSTMQGLGVHPSMPVTLQEDSILYAVDTRLYAAALRRVSGLLQCFAQVDGCAPVHVTHTVLWVAPGSQP